MRLILLIISSFNLPSWQIGLKALSRLSFWIKYYTETERNGVIYFGESTYLCTIVNIFVLKKNGFKCRGEGDALIKDSKFEFPSVRSF